ncbi:MAG: chromate transporter [Candidatus Gastranaerophilales bacterium]|nr:chromate transporter [Candidatus Gastranaerophilales bacterium]
MIKTCFLLFFEYFKIGLLSIGGGYATIPFLYYLAEHYPWFSPAELTNMIAVANITPGPIGLNMATYAGFSTAGFIGSCIATLGLVLPSLLIVTTVAKLMKQDNICEKINRLFTGLRPTACAMITAVGLKMLYQLMINTSTKEIDTKTLVAFIIIFIISFTKANKPIFIILFGGILGIIIKSF